MISGSMPGSHPLGLPIQTEKNKLILLGLARTWTQAAVHSESVSVVVVANPPEARAAP
jgi:hypothetical protein